MRVVGFLLAAVVTSAGVGAHEDLNLELEVREQVLAPCVTSVATNMALTDAQAELLYWFIVEGVYLQSVVAVLAPGDSEWYRASTYKHARAQCIALWTDALIDVPHLLDDDVWGLIIDRNR